MIMSERAGFGLAQRLRAEGATIAEVFTFLSGLYFRGKIAYARAFGCSAAGICSSLVITPTRGLIDADTHITLDDLREFAEVDIEGDNPRYRKPLERDVRRLARQLPSGGEVILLGSVATGKYVDVLVTHLGERVRFPVDFVGRGDMSRGGLLLRSAADGEELHYIAVAGAIRKGKRPAKLTPRRYPKTCPS
jgi:hypothetical protein